MTERAVAGVEYFVADEREVHRDGWTYTADTLATFEDEEIVLILGADAASNLATWNRADEVMERAEIAVAPRPGTLPGEVDDVVAGAVWLDMAPLQLSGTLIRERVAEGRSARFLVRDSVWRYFMDRSLYADKAMPPVP